MLAEEIATCALDHYGANLTKGKPKEGSEWTVYAAIVAQRHSELWVVSSATGTKCTAQRAEGCILHDAHAEVLTRRGLMRVLWIELLSDENQSTDPRQTLLEKGSNGKQHLRKDTLLHLYSSDSPCGDASIYPIGKSSQELQFTGAKLVVSEDTGMTAGLCGGNHQLLHGTAVAREDTQILGKLRTKSGRSNLPSHLRSTSMSCSDKICQYCVLGLQGALLSSLVHPIYLSSVVVSHDRRILKSLQGTMSVQVAALERAIPDRARAIWDCLASSKEGSKLLPKGVIPLVHVVAKVFPSGKAVMSAQPHQDIKTGQISSSSNREDDVASDGKKRRRSDSARLDRSSMTVPTVSPCGMMLNWQHTGDAKIELLVGARGIRQGKKPKSSADYQRLASRLSRRDMMGLWSDYQQTTGDASDQQRSYRELKESVADPKWLETKRRLLTEGPLAGWLRNTEKGDFRFDCDGEYRPRR